MNTFNITLNDGEEIKVRIDNVVIESDMVGAWDNEFGGQEVEMANFDLNAISYDYNNFTQDFSEKIEEEVKSVILTDYWDKLEEIYNKSFC